MTTFRQLKKQDYSFFGFLNRQNQEGAISNLGIAFFVENALKHMTLSEKIKQDLKAAMKSGDRLRLNTVRSLRAHIIELTKRGSGDTLTAEEELSVLMTAAKKRKEAIEMYEKGGRADLVDQEQKELMIINEYLPKPMTRDEAEDRVMKIISHIGASSAKDFGKVMPLAMKELKGRIDGKVVQEIVRQSLEVRNGS